LRKNVSSILKTFPQQDPEEEHLCNVFAEELLMPGFAILRDFRRNGVGPDSLIRLHTSYEVSLFALLRRLTRISRGATVAIVWNFGAHFPAVSWSSSFPFRRAILCDTERTPIEAALSSSQTETGKCAIILNGVRTHWGVAALRLTHSHEVLSVLRDRTEPNMTSFDWRSRSSRIESMTSVHDSRTLGTISSIC